MREKQMNLGNNSIQLREEIGSKKESKVLRLKTKVPAQKLLKNTLII
jgi:hypothetical protein